MNILIRQIFVVLLLTCLSHANSFAVVQEIAGGSDFPNVGRVAGSTMIGFDIQEYGEGSFIESDNGERKNNFSKRFVEGSLSSYFYVLKV